MKNLLLVLIVAFIFISCRKEGTGGDASILASVAHHTAPIKGATIYIKFGAKEKPANPTSDYDLKVQASPNEDHAHIEGLKWGEYFVYAVGFDSSIMQPVTGGLPLEIKYKDRKKETGLSIPVTE